MKRYLIAIAIFVVVCVVVWQLIHYPWGLDYEVVALPVNDEFSMSLSGLPENCVSAINDLGQVAGHYQQNGDDGFGYCVYIWDQENGLVELPRIGNMSSYFITDINNKGQAVGRISDSIFNGYFGKSVAFIRDADGTITRLPVEGKANTYATGINDKGQVVGIICEWVASRPMGESRRVFLWDKIDGMRIIDEIGSDVTDVCGINEAGQIVGLQGQRGRARTFVWTEMAGPVYLDVNASRVFDIDEEGNVLGVAIYKGKLFLGNESNGVTMLGVANDGVEGCKMNDRGDVVGAVYDDGLKLMKKYRLRYGHTKAFLRTAEGKTVSLDPLFDKGKRFYPVDINNNGWIVGYTHEWPNGKRQVVMLKGK